MSERTDRLTLCAIAESLEKISAYTAGIATSDQLYAQPVVFDAVLMNFVVIGEMAGKLSEPFRQAHPDIAWPKIRGVRNIIAHDYFGVDAEEIWQIVNGCLREFRFQIDQLLRTMPDM